YELDGDALKVCYSVRNAERPGAFATKADGKTTEVLLTLKRKPKDEAPPPEPPPAPDPKKPDEPKPAANPDDLVKAALARPDPGDNYPALPALSTEMRGQVCSEIAASDAVRGAYEKLDAKRRNVDWFDGVAELEKRKAVWCLLSCLCHH